MIDIYKNIITSFDNDATLASMFPRGIFNGWDREDSTMPIAVIEPISEQPIWSTCTETKELSLRMSVYTNNDTDNFTAIDEIKRVFDDISFTMDNGELIRFNRVQILPPTPVEQDIWRSSIQYNVFYE